MNTITNVQFLDPAYTTLGTQGIPALKVHEAYGYVEYLGSDIALSFIVKNAPETLWRKFVRYCLHRGRGFMVKGLMIPNGAFLTHHTKSVFTFKKGAQVIIKWRDVVFLENVYIRPCHTMKTLGTLHEAQNDFVVVHLPKTIRTWPWPRRVHAKDAEYLVIPIPLITSCAEIS